MVVTFSGCWIGDWWNRRRIISSLHENASYFNNNRTNNDINNDINNNIITNCDIVGNNDIVDNNNIVGNNNDK